MNQKTQYAGDQKLKRVINKLEEDKIQQNKKVRTVNLTLKKAEDYNRNENSCGGLEHEPGVTDNSYHDQKHHKKTAQFSHELLQEILF